MESVLERVSIALHKEGDKNRPKVCLTWAQSLDGKLAARPGAQTLISGPESMKMTHGLRALHDGILVGVGTVLADDPRLTCRMDSHTTQIVERMIARNQVVSTPGKRQEDFHPVPVILDAALRTPSTARCLQTEISSTRCKPLIFHQQPHQFSGSAANSVCPRLARLAETLPVPESSGGEPGCPKLDLRCVLKELHHRGIREVMVEGGATVISSFLAAGIWDVAVVTVAPRIFHGGVSLDDENKEVKYNIASLSAPQWNQLGEDAVLTAFR